MTEYEIRLTIKDEMKNRISMALKDPILQQCFEIICKENAELKEKLGNYQKGMFDEIEKRDINLTKAIEIIKDFLLMAEVEHLKDRYETVDEAEQFLKESE